jgi:hypothetical protein
MNDCDCGTCCNACGHLDGCIRWELTGDEPDARELALTADGVSPR